jgi:CDP-diacylglycerol--glycerol-3-phosphate 3-phosphatidyltransferase
VSPWSRSLSLANAITALRFVAVPALASCASTGRRAAFLTVLGLAFLSDVADGWVARRLGETSELGARLDTAADFALFVTVPACGWLLWPDVVRSEAPFLVALAISYASPIAIGFVKYRRFTNHHTWAGKLSGSLLAVTAVVLVAGGSPWPFRVAVAVVVLADLEEIAITAIQPRWRPVVPTVWHALRDARRPATG